MHEKRLTAIDGYNERMQKSNSYSSQLNTWYYLKHVSLQTQETRCTAANILGAVTTNIQRTINMHEKRLTAIDGYYDWRQKNVSCSSQLNTWYYLKHVALYTQEPRCTAANILGAVTTNIQRTINMHEKRLTAIDGYNDWRQKNVSCSSQLNTWYYLKHVAL
ncbi:hypothetical protein WA026_013453 [Henosepilachna vigintioctopunctata]|uniref:Uncharacterized protein n=1 Tax=Henosepilachna vigintioctopunctata TaxID=420089 RepID=A0AAW1VF06_9CUCU